VVFAARSDTGYTSLKTSRAVHLGTIKVPADLSLARIVPGEDSDVGDNEVTSTAMARLNEKGVPVGQASFGKGPEAIAPGLSLTGLDVNVDGLPDVFDADDDGDGIVDDFENGAESWPVPADSTYRPHFFMNLKVRPSRSSSRSRSDRPCDPFEMLRHVVRKGVVPPACARRLCDQGVRTMAAMRVPIHTARMPPAKVMPA
jgi:hypothetical protein